MIILNSMGALTFGPEIPQINLAPSTEAAIREIETIEDGVLLLEGGADIHPSIYGERNAYSSVSAFSRLRDARELALIDAALRCKRPIIGICRGHQLFAAYMGGKLWQDISIEANANHNAVHAVVAHSIFKEFAGNTYLVNSYHHQAVKTLPACGVEIAAALDGINEGIYYPEHRAITFQWHPEFMNDYELLHWALGVLEVPTDVDHVEYRLED